eukprot:Selendium_serpulae@DN5525_c0_g1_i1.p1
MANMKGAQTETNAKLGELMTDLVMKQVIDDKLRAEKEVETAIAAEKASLDETEKSKRDDEYDDDIATVRERRIAQMKKQQKEADENKALGHGTYDEIKQDEFLKAVTSSHRAVVHFYHKSFQRSKIFDRHLLPIAQKHVSARFIKIDAEKSPFFVEKLAIRVLPTVVIFIDGVAKYRIVGFQELGGDDFPTGRLAKLLKRNDGITESLQDYGDGNVVEDDDYESD